MLGNILEYLRNDVCSSTGFSPFEVVYKTSPRHVVNLVDLPGKKNVQANNMVEEVQATHEVVRANIIEANAKYEITVDKHRQEKLFLGKGLRRELVVEVVRDYRELVVEGVDNGGKEGRRMYSDLNWSQGWKFGFLSPLVPEVIRDLANLVHVYIGVLEIDSLSPSKLYLSLQL
nr:transposon Ty3-I Gag-Pol polyprotein [Tanacetum cinerariifolium]